MDNQHRAQVGFRSFKDSTPTEEQAQHRLCWWLRTQGWPNHSKEREKQESLSRNIDILVFQPIRCLPTSLLQKQTTTNRIKVKRFNFWPMQSSRAAHALQSPRMCISIQSLKNILKRQVAWAKEGDGPWLWPWPGSWGVPGRNSLHSQQELSKFLACFVSPYHCAKQCWEFRWEARLTSPNFPYSSVKMVSRDLQGAPAQMLCEKGFWSNGVLLRYFYGICPYGI